MGAQRAARLAPLAAILLSACLSGACATKGAGLNREAHPLRPLRVEAAKASKAVLGRLRGRTAVLDLVEAQDITTTSEFGQFFSELLTGELLARKPRSIEVIDRREVVKALQDSVVFGRPEVVEALTERMALDTLISGTYRETARALLVTIKATDARAGTMLGSWSFEVPADAALKRMVAHRFRPFGVPVGERAPKAEDVLRVDAGVYYRGGDGQLHPVYEGMVLSKEDNYAVFVRPESDCYLYALQADDSEEVFHLFPNAKFNSAGNPVLGGRDYWLPEGRELFFLDGRPGREEIWVIASKEPIDAIAMTGPMRLPTVTQAIRTMGLGGARNAETTKAVRLPGRSDMDLVVRKLSYSGGFFYRLSFVQR